VRGASFHARRGEIVGLAGLVGCGKSEVARAIYGLEKIRAGQVRLHGENVTGLRPAKMLRRGLFYSPPDRREEGLVMMRSCHENIALPALGGAGFSSRGFLNHRRGAATTRRLAEKFRLSPMRMNRAVEFFSGGNQQKLILAREMVREPRVLLIGQPTRGVDIGAIEFIHRKILALRDQGSAILLVSVELEEILALADRIAVMFNGAVVGETPAAAADEKQLGRWMAGVRDES